MNPVALNITLSNIPEFKHLMLLQIGVTPWASEDEKISLAVPAGIAQTLYTLIGENNRKLNNPKKYKADIKSKTIIEIVEKLDKTIEYQEKLQNQNDQLLSENISLLTANQNFEKQLENENNDFQTNQLKSGIRNFKKQVAELESERQKLNDRINILEDNKEQLKCLIISTQNDLLSFCENNEARNLPYQLLCDRIKESGLF